MLRHALIVVGAVFGWGANGLWLEPLGLPPAGRCAGQEPAAPAKPRMTSQELADWIDARFADEYARSGEKPAALVDDATFLRRLYLDLQGRIPTVAQLRDFLGDGDTLKRQNYVERLVNADQRPQRFAQRTADHLARVWRRMMVPASAPGARMAGQLEPWLALQFSQNIPYDQFARKLLMVSAAPRGLNPVPQPPPADADAAAGVFQQAVGQMPENLASAYVRVFLGVRLNCAQCHDHPFTGWKLDDFWGIAAFFAADPGGAPPVQTADGDAAAQPAATTQPVATSRPAPTIKSEANGDDVTYTAKLLWSKEPIESIPAGQSSRELLAEWITSPENPNFAATAVNRMWQYLCGRGLAGSVDDLDRVSEPERRVLDELADQFVDSGFDVRWLLTGICKSRTYQQTFSPAAADDAGGFTHRPLKSLLPEQVFDSLEQALGLPVAKADNGPRFNGERDQFVARMNESAPETPSDYKAGIPQALMLMNGRLTADATSLDTSRTLRAVVEAPFLKLEEKIETLYLAALSRAPKSVELEYLLEHVREQPGEQEQKQAFSEILWGLLNSPEFVLSR
jgi:hypothetical protein